MPTKLTKPTDLVKATILEKWRWVYDPIPDWILRDKVMWTKFAQISTKLAARQLELEKQALELEIERMNLLGELYSKGMKK